MEDMSALVAALQQQNDYLGALLKEKGLVTKTPANFQTATGLHGLGGIFGQPGMERDVITAHVRPHGIASVLPRFPSVSEDPTFASLTGYTDVVGSEPDNACEDAPSGYVKSCFLTARFGLLRRDTQTIEMDKVMLQINRGDTRDLMLRGQVLGLQGMNPSGLNQSQILNVITMSEMVQAAVNIERALNTGLWQSTVAGNWGWPGLDAQIATGQGDANTNTACPSLDSDVKEFSYNDVCGTTLDIVEYLSMLEYYLYYNAESMGLAPVKWVVAMRPQLWQELSACWPCKYNTNRCLAANIGESVVSIDGRENIVERDAMRAGMYIDINGRRYPVVTDTGIFEHNNINNSNLAAGQYASSIYMVPMTILDNFPVTYMEYIDYRQAQPDASLLQGKQDFWWTDQGMYSWSIENNKWCYKLSLKIEPRVVLRTPHLAGRIDHVRYSPLQHLREPDPDSPYHADGGVSVRETGTRYAVWASGGE